MKHLYMFVGLPLSGKTTFRKKWFSHFPGIIVSSDDQIEALAELNNMTYNEAFDAGLGERANQIAYDLAKYAVERTVSVVWDQTNLTRKSRERKLALFPECYYKIAYVFLAPSSDVLMERQNNPDRKGKTIPLTVLNKMRAVYEAPLIGEGFHEIRVEDFRE